MDTDKIMKFYIGMDNRGNQYLYSNDEEVIWIHPKYLTNDEEVIWIHPKYLTKDRLHKAISELHSKSFYNCCNCKNVIVLNYTVLIKLLKLFGLDAGLDAEFGVQNNYVLGLKIKVDNDVEMIYIM